MTTTHTPPTPSPDPAAQRSPVAGHTRRLAAPNRRQLPAAGPAAGLLELPDPSGVSLTSPSEVDAHLSAVQKARQKQLDALPSFNHDPVTAAYRATVEGIRADVRAARDRVAAGLYGICTRCENAISAPRLQARPWVSTCVSCAQRSPR